MSPWELESVKDGPRNLLLKFGQNLVSNSWDIPDMEKCCQDKCCRDKCYCDSWSQFKIIPWTYVSSFVKIGSVTAEILQTLSFCGWWWWVVCKVIFMSKQTSKGNSHSWALFPETWDMNPCFGATCPRSWAWFWVKKYRKAENVQRRVPSTNVQVLFVFEVVLIVIFHHKSSSIITRLPS